MGKLLQLNLKIAKLDKEMEKITPSLSLYIKLRNDIWKEIFEIEKQVDEKNKKITELIEGNEEVAEYKKLNDEFLEKRETLLRYKAILNMKRTLIYKGKLVKKVKQLVDEVTLISYKKKAINKTNPILTYIDEKNKVIELKEDIALKQTFFDKAQAKANSEHKVLKKLMNEKEKLQNQKKKVLQNDKNRDL